MKRLALLMTVLICSAATIAAEGDPPSPEKQMQRRIQNARKELEQQRQQLDRQRQEFERQRDQIQPEPPGPWHKPMHMGVHKPICALLMAICAVVHILVAIWIFQDIRMRGAGSGIWIVIALIAGLLGALVYAVVRLATLKNPDKMHIAYPLRIYFE